MVHHDSNTAKSLQHAYEWTITILIIFLKRLYTVLNPIQNKQNLLSVDQTSTFDCIDEHITHTDKHTRTLSPHICVHIHTHTHMYTQIHHTHTDRQIHKYAHTHRHTHTHIKNVKTAVMARQLKKINETRWLLSFALTKNRIRKQNQCVIWQPHFACSSNNFNNTCLLH